MKDPVCDREIPPGEGLSASYLGRDYSFCSAECKRRFDRDPRRYAGSVQEAVKFNR